MQQELRDVFTRFATFGNRQHHGEVQMDSRSCQKLFKDAGLTGRKLTSTDIDLMFTKVKPKGERKIDFADFLHLTRMVADKVGRSHAELAVQIAATEPFANTTEQQQLGHTPRRGSRSTTPNKSQARQASGGGAEPRVMARLHPDWYEVRNPNSTSDRDAFYYVNRKTNETSWKIPLMEPSENMGPVPGPPPLSDSGSPVSPNYPSVESKGYESKDSAPPFQQQGSSSSVRTTDSGERRSIFDKLTDPTLYTGAHKHRFDPRTGKGRGLDGRDSAVKADKSKFKGHTNTRSDEVVHNIKNILRN